MAAVNDEPFPLSSLRATRRSVLLSLSAVPLLAATRARPIADRIRLGVNFVEDASAPLGQAAARESLRKLADAGASLVALIPFFWQSHARDTALVPGSALPPERLAHGIQDARALGLDVVVKPHVWVPERWAGSIRFATDDDWKRWFEAYAAALRPYAEVAQRAGAHTFCIGTELVNASRRPEWSAIIAETRAQFSGTLMYVAHNAAEAETVRFWDDLDVVAMSSYPVMGEASDVDSWRQAMVAELTTLAGLASRHAKPAWLGEIGLRSAVDATRKPWESTEERAADPDMALQEAVLRLWIETATAHGIDTALIWRWISDPASGGLADTDFTIQNKPAQGLLRQS